MGDDVSANLFSTQMGVYGPGGQYLPHFDHFSGKEQHVNISSLINTKEQFLLSRKPLFQTHIRNLYIGDRIATIMLYVSSEKHISLTRSSNELSPPTVKHCPVWSHFLPRRRRECLRPARRRRRVEEPQGGGRPGGGANVQARGLSGAVRVKVG